MIITPSAAAAAIREKRILAAPGFRIKDSVSANQDPGFEIQKQVARIQDPGFTSK